MKPKREAVILESFETRWPVSPGESGVHTPLLL